jgi:hypothetical protein
VNLIDELHVAPMPPRRRVSFLLGGAVSSSMLRGDSETKCLVEEVVDDGLDDDDSFLFVKRLVVLFHCTLVTNIISGFLRTMCGSRTGGWSLPCVMSD